MHISQSDYLKFYNEIRRELTDVIYQKEGVRPFYIPVTMEDISERCVEPMGTGIIASPDQTIGLNEYEYGDFIDKHYKDIFISHCKSTNSYDYNFFGALAKKIAKEIFEINKRL